jgi:predicted dehydrogenase
MPESQHALGVAVVGYSFMGKAHSNAWRNVGAFYPQAQQVRQQVLVGRDDRAVKEAAARYGWSESATDWSAVVQRDDIDIVDICTPGHLHAEIAIAALEAGKHVLVEKPLANTAEESVVMALAAEEASRRGVRSMVGFNYRRVPALALARDIIARGQVGEVRQIRAAYLQDWLSDASAPMTWRLRRETAGSGALGDLASHVVDQVRVLVDEPVTRAAGRLHTFVGTRSGESGPEPVTVDDAAWATLESASGVVASLEVSRVATGRKNGLTIEVYGSEGSLAFDLERLNELQVLDGTSDPQGMRRVLVTEKEHPYLEAWWPPGHVLGWDHTFTSQAADFLTAIASGNDPSPSFADGLRVQRVLAAIEASAAGSGVVVDVAQED